MRILDYMERLQTLTRLLKKRTYRKCRENSEGNGRTSQYNH